MNVPRVKTKRAAPAANAGSATVDVTTISPVFKLVFITVATFTVVALLLNVVLVVALKAPNEQAKALIETCSTIVKAGFGAIVGLIGGKAA